MATFMKQSMISGKMHKLEIPGVTQEEFDKRLAMWHGGALIQEAFPELPAEVREFIMTGITPDEWNETFKDEDDE